MVCLFVCCKTNKTKYFGMPAERDDGMFFCLLQKKKTKYFGMPAERDDGMFLCLLQKKKRQNILECLLRGTTLIFRMLEPPQL